MTTLRLLAAIAVLLLAGGAAMAAWIRWRRWKGDEQDTGLLTGIVDLRRRFHDGDLDARLPAKGRGFARDVETAVNKVLDEAAVHLRTRRAEAAALAQALDVLGGVVTRTVEQLDATVRQIEGLSGALGQRASLAFGGPPLWDAVEALGTDDTRCAETATALAEHSRSAAATCRTALEQLRATLGSLGHEAADTSDGIRGLHAQWNEVRTGIDVLAQATGTTEVLAVNATLAAGRERDAHGVLGRFAAEADQVAHDAGHALARVTGATNDWQERLGRLVGASAVEHQLGRAADEVSALDGALARIHDLPPSLAAFATVLSGLANTQAQAMTALSAARPDAARLAGELQDWTTAARRIGNELAQAAGVLTAARREAQRLLAKEASA